MKLSRMANKQRYVNADEVLEIVPKTENILEREKYYIQKYYMEDPERSLNIMCTKLEFDFSGGED